MGYFQWSDKLDIGVKPMNDEHQVLLSIMNKLYDQNQASKSHAQLKLTVEELENYTLKHFKDEEAYMDSIGFPDADKHKIIHTQLLKRFGDQKAKFLQGGGAVHEGFFQFLKLWLSAHIQGIDIKYGIF